MEKRISRSIENGSCCRQTCERTLGKLLEVKEQRKLNIDIHFRDVRLQSIWKKVQTGERLSFDDGIVLFQTNDVLSLGKMAHFVQKNRSGDAVYFVLNQKIEPTNVCVLSCKFCNFAVKQGDSAAYEMTIAEMLAKLTPGNSRSAHDRRFAS